MLEFESLLLLFVYAGKSKQVGREWSNRWPYNEWSFAPPCKRILCGRRCESIALEGGFRQRRNVHDERVPLRTAEREEDGEWVQCAGWWVHDWPVWCDAFMEDDRGSWKVAGMTVDFIPWSMVFELCKQCCVDSWMRFFVFQTRRDIDQMVDFVNAGRPQCPVGLNTLVVGRKTNSLDRQPYVYLK